MKLAYVELCGFRGVRKPMRIDFGDGFTIIDGRNGVGKSTLLDAVEFALTGALSKYSEARADGETAADYTWWMGDGDAPPQRYVTLGFSDGHTVHRTQLENADPQNLRVLAAKLCDTSLAPKSPLAELCRASIIRDEHVASLSVDLKESERYALVRDALGASNAAAWIERGANLVAAAKKRLDTTQEEVSRINVEVTAIMRRMDEARASLVSETVVGDAVLRLRAFAQSEAAPDLLSGPARAQLANVNAQIDALRAIGQRWTAVEQERGSLSSLRQARDAAAAEADAATGALDALGSVTDGNKASTIAARAKELIALADMGRHVGLLDGHCPLCAAGQNEDDFQRGIASLEAFARRLDAQAVAEAQQEQVRRDARARLTTAQVSLERAESRYREVEQRVTAFDEQRAAAGVEKTETLDHVRTRFAQLRGSVEAAQRDLRILDTIRLSGDIERASAQLAEAQQRQARANERAGRARKAETAARALHNAARRADSETLDQRLDRVLPLMSELYHRLRPHPIWRDMEYSIRGDVRRFLKLQVGDELNPQFIFSSGERRATGLAFLLAVNLSLAWSRWATVLLDDPIQHVDDFRTVHLAELAAHLVADGRQIICTVEDPALADLLCRRLPVAEHGSGRRVTLGRNSEGDLAVVASRDLVPLAQHAFVAVPHAHAAG